MWKSYKEVWGHLPDFRVKYRFYREEEGGRRYPIYPGLRCDFSYADDDISKTGIYAIHPEFEDEQGNIIQDYHKEVPIEGTANMWIIYPEMRREVHLKKIQTGVKGYFMEGSRRIAEVEVLKILYISENFFNA